MASLHDDQFEDNDRRILEGERLLLRVMLASPDGVATLADACPTEYRDKPFPDGGKWRGAIPKRLNGRGIIGPVVTAGGGLSALRSYRKARRCGTGVEWKLHDPDAGRNRLSHLDNIVKDGGEPTLFDFM